MLTMLSLLLISIPVGLLGSLTGLGGASILIPIMVSFGIPVKEAIACGMASIIATSSGSAASDMKNRIANPRLAMYLAMFTTVGAIGGATITTWIAPVYLYFFFAAFLCTSFLRLRRKGREIPTVIRESRFSGWLALKGSYFDRAAQQRVDYKVRNAFIGGGGMLIAGLAAGMLGIGAGAFKVTIQENVMHLPPKVSSATSNFIIGITALAGTSVYMYSGLLNITIMGPMAVGTALGGMLGGVLLGRIPDRSLRILFFVIIIYIIIQMVMHGLAAV
ncbi:MAG TPA: sulfite exporter TauE/SafE family protein [Thermodesulfobacteriota bacterium]|nr:sulfite exporter TauE/SafE family protein [Thermodesulfobacteriota bacterium]